MILRNDDVCFATTVDHLKKFTDLTDRHGYRVIHAITPRGVCWTSGGWLGSRKNSEICALGAGLRIEDNPDLVDFLRSRADKDVFGIHGLWHTHSPRPEEWIQGRQILLDLGLYPQYLVPPFNEGRFKSRDFIVSGLDADSFESVEDVRTPIAQMHSWRYDPEMWSTYSFSGSKQTGAYSPTGRWWTWEDFERRLEYPVMAPSATNGEKYTFLAPRIVGKWLDIGCNTGELLSRVPNGVGVDASLWPLTLVSPDKDVAQAKAEQLPFSSDQFDTVVLCGVIEQCADWRAVLTEALRVTKPGGRVIGTCAYPGTKYGTIGRTRWVRSVIYPAQLLTARIERINGEHYFFEVSK